jgi:hypothetical protein
MPKRKPVVAEIVTVPREPGAKLQDLLASLVREEVAAQRGAESKPTLDDQRQLSKFERKKHALYYDKWGCQRCNSKKTGHWAKGLCSKCSVLLQARYAALKREWDSEHPAQNTNEITARVRSAERLLGTARPVRMEE